MTVKTVLVAARR